MKKQTADLPRPAPQEAAHKKMPRPGEKKYSLYLLRRCLAYFAAYKLRIFIAVIAMAVAAASEGATAYLVKPAMDDIFMDKNSTALILVPLAFIIVTLAKSMGRITQNYMMQSCGLKVLERLRSQLYTKIIRLPVSFYEKTQVGMLMSRVINDVACIQSSMPAVVQAVRQFLTMIALLCVVFYQDFQLALLAALVLPVAFFPFVYFGRKLRKIGRKRQAVWAEAAIILQEILSGIRVVKAFSTERQEGERFDQTNRRWLKTSLRRVVASESSSAVMEVIGAIGVSLVLFYGGLKVISGESTPGTFFSFVAGLALLYDPVKKLSAANNDIQEALASAERVFEILDSEDIVEEKGSSRTFERDFNQIELSCVSFAYGSAEPALKDISLTIRRGERLALVGPSGAGKSTFVNLLPRFYDPTSGSIFVDGADLREFDLTSLRSGISIVSQDNFLFNASIGENIAYGQPGFTREQIVLAARAAYAHDFVSAMPEGYETVIGERGVKLSGGQKQRLTIARAIAKDAPLLILDEATSALDSESEQIVQQALENLMRGRTSIVIAHRLSTVLGSDRILVMNEGRIEAAGTHRELLNSSPLYAKLYEIQFGEGQ